MFLEHRTSCGPKPKSTTTPQNPTKLASVSPLCPGSPVTVGLSISPSPDPRTRRSPPHPATRLPTPPLGQPQFPRPSRARGGEGGVGPARARRLRPAPPPGAPSLPSRPTRPCRAAAAAATTAASGPWSRWRPRRAARRRRHRLRGAPQEGGGRCERGRAGRARLGGPLPCTPFSGSPKLAPPPWLEDPRGGGPGWGSPWLPGQCSAGGPKYLLLGKGSPHRLCLLPLGDPEVLGFQC